MTKISFSNENTLKNHILSESDGTQTRYNYNGFSVNTSKSLKYKPDGTSDGAEGKGEIFFNNFGQKIDSYNLDSDDYEFNVNGAAIVYTNAVDLANQIISGLYK